MNRLDFLWRFWRFAGLKILGFGVCFGVRGGTLRFQTDTGLSSGVWGGEAMIFGYSTLFYGWVFGPTNGSVWVFMDPTWNDFAFRLKVYGCQGSVLVELRVVGPGVPGKRIPGLSILLALSRLFGLSACMEHLVENVCILVALSRLFG